MLTVIRIWELDLSFVTSSMPFRFQISEFDGSTLLGILVSDVQPQFKYGLPEFRGTDGAPRHSVVVVADDAGKQVSTPCNSLQSVRAAASYLKEGESEPRAIGPPPCQN